MQPIYLDYNATTPVHDDVLEAMSPYFSQKFGNAASSTHAYGWVAKQAIKTAKLEIANAIDCDEQQLIFTSGSTEAINLAIKGVWELYSPRKGNHIITCKTEHKAVLDVCKYLEKYHAAEVTYLGVNQSGEINLEELKESITDRTILVAIMHSNNETGVIHPVKKIAEIVHEGSSIFMSDCTQSLGKMPVSVRDLGIDICCVSAHKCYGPKGIGALYYSRKNPRVALRAQIHGGGHQKQLRSGTLNVPAIVGFGKAAQIVTANLQNNQHHLSRLRNQFEQQLKTLFSATILAEHVERLPNTSNVHFPNTNAAKLIELTNGTMAVAMGSACTAENLKGSHVIQAMGYDISKFSTVRFSIGLPTTLKEISTVVNRLSERIS